MNELAKKVADRVGISEDQAQKAVDVVVAFFKEKLPGPISGQLDTLLGQGGSAADTIKDFGSKFGL